MEPNTSTIPTITAATAAGNAAPLPGESIPAVVPAADTPSAVPAPSVPPLPPQAAQTPPPAPGIAPPPPPQPTNATVGLPIQYAGFGQRLIAAIVDGFIIGFVYVLVVTVPTMILSLASGATGPDSSGMALFSSLAGMGLWGISMLAGFAYWIYFTGKSGQTLGKKMMKIKVIDAQSGLPPSFMNAFLREVIGKFVSNAVFSLGYLWMLWDDKKQTWHDKIAGTIVIKAE